MRNEYWIALWIVIVLVGIAYLLPPSDDHWSMVYEAVQTPEVAGGPRRFVLFNEDHLTRQACADLFNEHLRRLNNNTAVIEYLIECKYLDTRGHGTDFQRQIHWMIP